MMPAKYGADRGKADRQGHRSPGQNKRPVAGSRIRFADTCYTAYPKRISALAGWTHRLLGEQVRPDHLTEVQVAESRARAGTGLFGRGRAAVGSEEPYRADDRDQG